MSDSQWDTKLKAFFKKAGDDFKRAGADVKVEAERLLAEAKDPERTRKIKEGLAEMSVWAKKTADELAGYVETGVKKAEVVLKDVVKTPKGAPAPSAPKPKSSAPRAAAPTAEKRAEPAPTAPSTLPPTKKTVGRGGKKAGDGGAKSKAKKPLGRKRS